jgi:hypothetical protein
MVRALAESPEDEDDSVEGRLCCEVCGFDCARCHGPRGTD